MSFVNRTELIIYIYVLQIFYGSYQTIVQNYEWKPDVWIPFFLHVSLHFTQTFVKCLLLLFSSLNIESATFQSSSYHIMPQWSVFIMLDIS